MLIGPPVKYSCFKEWPWKSGVKAMGEVKVRSHNTSLASYRFTSFWFHVNQPPPIPEIQHFQNLTLKIQSQGHRSRSYSSYNTIDYPFRSMSIGPPIPGTQLFQNLTLKIQGQGHGWGQSWKSQHGPNIWSTYIPFIPCQSGVPFLSYDFFKIWPWKSRNQGHGWGHSSKS